MGIVDDIKSMARAAGAKARALWPGETEGSESGSRATPEASLEYLYRQMWVNQDQRQAILPRFASMEAHLQSAGYALGSTRTDSYFLRLALPNSEIPTVSPTWQGRRPIDLRIADSRVLRRS